MNKYLPAKLNKIAEYVAGKQDFRIKLDSNESFVKMPQRLRERISGLVLGAELNRYPEPEASELISAYSEYIDVEPGYIMAGNGSDELLSIIISAFLEKGDRMLIIPPDFGMYKFYASIYEVEVLEYGRRGAFELDVEGMPDFVKANDVKLVMFSNPNNPTGSMLARKELLELADRTDAILVSDEAYMDFADESVVRDAAERENFIVLRTLSKAFGLAALRCGFAVTNKEMHKALMKVKSTYNVNTLTQLIGTAVLRDVEFTRYANNAIVDSTRELYNGLCRLSGKDFKVYPTAANFVYIETPRSSEIFEKLGRCGISIRNYGDALRISAGAPEENAELLKELEEILGEDNEKC